MKHLLRFLVAATAVMIGMSSSRSVEFSPSEVARTLDITSFPNSIRPGLKPGTKTLAQNGFTEMVLVKDDPSSVEVYQPGHSWLFGITVLRSEGAGKALVCILDQALNGGTYLSLEPIELQWDKDGLLYATGRKVSDPRCELTVK